MNTLLLTVKSSAWLMRNRSSTPVPATRRFLPNPYAVQVGILRDRLPSDGGQASPSQGALQDRPLGSEQTTIQERCRYPAAFQIGHLLLSNRCCIESLELVEGLG